MSLRLFLSGCIFYTTPNFLYSYLLSFITSSNLLSSLQLQTRSYLLTGVLYKHFMLFLINNYFLFFKIFINISPMCYLMISYSYVYYLIPISLIQVTGFSFDYSYLHSLFSIFVSFS